jgi:hypothetical protein
VENSTYGEGEQSERRVWGHSDKRQTRGIRRGHHDARGGDQRQPETGLARPQRKVAELHTRTAAARALNEEGS